MGNTDNTPMADGTFSSAGVGPIWKEFMTEAYKYTQLPPRDFEKPDGVEEVRCGGKMELFKKGQAPERPGACKPGSGPRPSPGPRGPTAEATPVETAGVTAEPTEAPEVTEAPETTETPEATETPGPTEEPTPEPEETPEPTGPPGVGGDRNQ
jgi:membrane peptidoglycan carboxypeptidase